MAGSPCAGGRNRLRRVPLPRRSRIRRGAGPADDGGSDRLWPCQPGWTSPLLRDCREVYGLARETPGELLSENPGAAVLSGKTVWLSNAFEFRSLSAAGRLNPQPLIGMVERRFFSLILLQEDWPTLVGQASQPPTENTIWPREFVQALGRNYRPLRTFSCAGANDAFVPIGVPAAGKAAASRDTYD